LLCLIKDIAVTRVSIALAYSPKKKKGFYNIIHIIHKHRLALKSGIIIKQNSSCLGRFRLGGKLYGVRQATNEYRISKVSLGRKGVHRSVFFTAQQVVEKGIGVNKKIYCAFIDLAKVSKRWLDGVQETLSRHRVKTSKNVRKVQMKEMALRDAKIGCLDRGSWRGIGRSLK